MRSVILQIFARILMPVLMLFSLFILWRGHNLPGGGFAGGLLAALTFGVYGLAYRVADVRERLPVAPSALIGIGLLCAVLSGVPAIFRGAAFLTGQWHDPTKLGTPILFDIGVYVVVFGVLIQLLLTFEERDEDEEVPISE